MDLDRPTNSIAMRTDKSSFGTATARLVTESGGTWSSLLDFTEEEYMHSKARATDWCEYMHTKALHFLINPTEDLQMKMGKSKLVK